MYYYTYIHKSNKDNKLYIGYTNNLKHRLILPNLGKVDSTACRKPFKLIYFEGCLNKERAIKREKYFKTGFGRRFINSRI